MDQIQKAVERAKAERLLGEPSPAAEGLRNKGTVPQERQEKPVRQSVLVRPSTLEQNRIVAHDTSNGATLGFDLLRTKIVQHMKQNGLKTLLTTSPTPGCGKTVTSVNLAFSSARQSELQVVVLDLDLRKPHIARYLNLPPRPDIRSALNGDASLNDTLVAVSAGGPEFLLLPTLEPLAQPAEALTSSGMKDILGSLKKLPNQVLVILDTPPILFADDVIALLPQVDAVLLVIASGQTTTQEIESCRKLIPKEKFLGIVLSKAVRSGSTHYGYSRR